jgi:gliding motility-associated protein GldM
MSLPKEPRQKMINIMYLVLTALLALNVSSEILNAFKTVNRSLENTNKTVTQSTATILKSLEDKTTENQTKDRALVWFPKAQQASTISKALYDRIEALKNKILTMAGGKPGDPSVNFKEDNLEIVTRMMVKEGEGKRLLADLNKYKTDILGIDPEIDSAFKTSLQIDLSNPPGRDGKKRDWDVAYFHMVPTVAGLTILSKFQNDIKTAENKVVAYCHQKVGEVKVIFDSYSAIVGQNSNYLMPGQKIEIKAGVGAFSKAAQPNIYIGGALVPLGEEGFALKELEAGANGQHKIPVKISFFNQTTGKMDERTYDVEYTVGSANASIALDEMNVLYIGYDNKVTIAASGAGDEKVNAVLSGGGGSLNKLGGGRYIAKVNTVTDDAKITVSVDGKVVGVSQFRVRTIPDPVATIGGVMSNENMTAGQMKAQTGVGAYIKDFPLKLQYTVVSFTISADNADGDIEEAPCTGNTWSPRALSIIKNLTSGRTVTVDNIRAQGPDGRVRKIPGLVYYIK